VVFHSNDSESTALTLAETIVGSVSFTAAASGITQREATSLLSVRGLAVYVPASRQPRIGLPGDLGHVALRFRDPGARASRPV